MRKPERQRSQRNEIHPNPSLIDVAGAGNVRLVRELLSSGADVDARNRNDETALSMAAAWNHFDVAQLLVQRGADPNIADKTGGTPLMLAAQNGNTTMVSALLARDADPNAADRFGNTVLMHVVWASKRSTTMQIVNELLRHGARINAINHEGKTALYFARQGGLRTLQRTLMPAIFPSNLPQSARSRSA